MFGMAVLDDALLVLKCETCISAIKPKVLAAPVIRAAPMRIIVTLFIIKDDDIEIYLLIVHAYQNSLFD